ncbi:MAG: Nif3-like dinuclear metal center hexameric protein [Clostridia bacterium]|nr:Nif3-like dinuclear metal center hexameric protein [Clostridia bacterium]
MTVRELYDRLSQMIPQSLSCEWDHDGLMICPDRDRKVSKVLVALDPTEDILELACREHFDVVLTHHPFLFHGLEIIDESDPKGKRVVELILNGVSVMCFHTRLDALEGGVNDALAETLELRLETVQSFPVEGLPMGRVGSLSKPCSLRDFVSYVRKILDAPQIIFGDAGREVSKVALLGGSGKDEIQAAKATGADTFLTGELGYHGLCDAYYSGINLIAAGHYETERPVIRVLSEMVKRIDSGIHVEMRDMRPYNYLKED